VWHVNEAPFVPFIVISLPSSCFVLPTLKYIFIFVAVKKMYSSKQPIAHGYNFRCHEVLLSQHFCQFIRSYCCFFVQRRQFDYGNRQRDDCNVHGKTMP